MRTQVFAPVRVVASHGVSTEERLLRLEKLDLSMVRMKLMEPAPEGKGWNEAQALEAELWYKRYLAAIIAYPEATKHVPNGPIDDFWHQHILDTMAYGPDCERVLGFFLHHYPYYGLRGDAAERDNSFDETNELYRLMFGVDCTNMANFNRRAAPTDGRQCGSSACQGGGTCRCCTVDGDRAPQMAGGCQGNACEGIGGEARACTSPDPDTGSTGCGQGPTCGRANAHVLVSVGVSCNSGGSGTGCGQGCSRGK